MRDIQFFHFPSIPSTNTWGKENRPSLNTTGITCVTADEQTKGRGQFNKSWISPKGVNLYASFCFYEANPCSFLQNLAQILSLSACTVLKSFGFSPSLKWPNDIFLHGKKIGGILCEASPMKELTWVVLRIGLNINTTQEDLQIIDQPATSLHKETGQFFSLTQIQERLVWHFRQDQEILAKQGFSPFLQDYVSQLSFIDKPFALKKGKEIVYATYRGISKEGLLLLTLPNKEPFEVHSREQLI